MSKPTELPPKYVPADVEPAITQTWEDANAYAADTSGGGEPYAIVIPPPNVTAALHLGHALNNTLQDVLIRRARMQGKNAVWLPGTDHAGIATQSVVDKRLQATGQKALKDYKLEEASGGASGGGGRDAFIEKVSAWKDEYEARIIQQLKDMGCSCDFARQAFTMDEPRTKAVREAFFRLFKDGLIYRGKRLVNWDPVTQTALADDEVEMEEVDGNFYYMKYPVMDMEGQRDKGVKGQSDKTKDSDDSHSAPRPLSPSAPSHITVATTRPETMLGDTAVAVNPNDPLNKSFIGRYVRLPIVNRIIPIIGDDYVVIPVSDADAEAAEASGLPVDPKARMASGFLKVTPAHDPNDYDIGKRHNLPIINVMAPDASISKDHGWPPEEWDNAQQGVRASARMGSGMDPFINDLLGLSREDARRAIIRWFKENDLLAEVKPYRHSVGHSYRSHVPVEPYYSDQWYLKVTDDKLKGAALRGMDSTQRQPASDLGGMGVPPAVGPQSGAGVSPAVGPQSGAGVSPAVGPTGRIARRRLPHIEQAGSTYFITLRYAKGQMNECERQIVLDAATHWHGDRMDLHAAVVMPDHVHLLITPKIRPSGPTAGETPAPLKNKEAGVSTQKFYSLSELLHSIKSFSAHAINKARGTTGRVWQDESFDRIVRDEQGFEEKWDYIRNNPVKAGLVTQPEDYAFLVEPDAAKAADGRLEARPTTDQNPAATGLKFTPERYAKTFQNWHENIRDWCISRQLWWGHRIPVWTRKTAFDGFPETLLGDIIKKAKSGDRTIFGEPRTPKESRMWKHRTSDNHAVMYEVDEASQTITTYVCLQNHDPKIEKFFVADGYVQDPDVLDTWFSSALWPMSTLGWPEKTPDLALWNPTSVLCTAREIITLWVSRMVMFNLYFLDQLPFKDVFIHAMIQDGHGQKMSKSLGNGVDPLDIIASHGSDAMRYTLTSMTTQTQDVRLPVDTIDPHSPPGSPETFTPRFITGPGGYKVAAPIQEHPPGSGKKMVSSYGVASGLAEPTEAMPVARNTSEKFDVGQRFATKLWNATRFALSHLEGDSAEAADGRLEARPTKTADGRLEARPTKTADDGQDARPTENQGNNPNPQTPDPRPQLSVADRWILSRTVRAIEAADKALASYDFHNYANGLYQFVWNEVCDWYIEAVKPPADSDGKMSATSQQVLATVLDVSLRLLHPVMPFITERLWSALSEVCPTRGVEGLACPADKLLVTAAWPVAEGVLHDEEAEDRFGRVQELVGMIREVRNGAKLPPREQVDFSVRASAEVAASLNGLTTLIGALTHTAVVALGPDTEKPEHAAVVTAPLGEGYLHIQIDADAEADRLGKRKTELEQSITTLDGRLGNEKYTSKAPAYLVQQTRDQREAAAAELGRVTEQLNALG